MVLHNSILKFDFAYKMIILRQYSKKNYRKIPKSSKFCIKSQILNCLEFNNYWILLDKIKICCRISIPESLFPLLVFEFETSGADILANLPSPLPAYIVYGWSLIVLLVVDWKKLNSLSFSQAEGDLVLNSFFVLCVFWYIAQCGI